jgi:hypothetical protein
MTQKDRMLPYQSALKLQGPEFFMEFYQMANITWLRGLFFITWLAIVVWPAQSESSVHSNRAEYKYFLSLGKFQGIRGYFPGNRDKSQPILCYTLDNPTHRHIILQRMKTYPDLNSVYTWGGGACPYSQN